MQRRRHPAGRAGLGVAVRSYFLRPPALASYAAPPGAEPDTWRQGVTDGRTLLDLALPHRSGVRIFVPSCIPPDTGTIPFPGWDTRAFRPVRRHTWMRRPRHHCTRSPARLFSPPWTTAGRIRTGSTQPAAGPA